MTTLLVTVYEEHGSTIEGPRTEYDYDGDGNRLRQRVYGPDTSLPLALSEAITYTNDVIGLTQVLVADDGTEPVYNLFGLDLILQDDDSAVRTLIADGLGSVRLETIGGSVVAVTREGTKRISRSRYSYSYRCCYNSARGQVRKFVRGSRGFSWRRDD